MHLFFSGIGGFGIGSLSLIVKQIGYDVSGSDQANSSMIEYLRNHGIENLLDDQSYESIAKIHHQKRIDWYIYSSALDRERERDQWPEMKFCREYQIKSSKRDELINYILKEKGLELIAIAGTHGKSTTTAMIVWLFEQMQYPISYSIGAMMFNGCVSAYHPQSKYWIYEADEYDRNFLSYSPLVSVITGIDWDHSDIYSTREIYHQAFEDFINQSKTILLWKSDFHRLHLSSKENFIVFDDENPLINEIPLSGLVNRRNAYQTIETIQFFLHSDQWKFHRDLMKNFPGLYRRFEMIAPNLYSDYAHTTMKIRGALQHAFELDQKKKKIIVVYEGVQNVRQHLMKEDFFHLFDDVEHLYILPTYLSREDPQLKFLKPSDLKEFLSPETQLKTTPIDFNDHLKKSIEKALNDDFIVLCFSAGTKHSLDQWLRTTFTSKTN